jgi:hypothetical protein
VLQPLPARAAIHDLLAVGHPTTHGPTPPCPPLSSCGAGCVGPMWAWAYRSPQGLRAIVRLPLGRLAIVAPTYAAPHLVTWGAAAEEDDDASDRIANPHALRTRLAASAHPCLMCQRGAVHEQPGDGDCEDGWLIVTQCAHPAVAAARRAVAATLPAFLVDLVAALRREHIAISDGALPRYEPVAGWLTSNLTNGPDPMELASVETRWLLFRCLAMATWTAAAAHADHPVASAMGTVFDHATLPPPRLRRVATMWAKWAGKSLQRVIAARCGAYTAATAARRARGVVLDDSDHDADDGAAAL